MNKWLQRIIVLWMGCWSGLTAVRAGGNNQSEGMIVFYTDQACFKMINQKELSYVQLYFFMERNQFMFVKQDTLYAAKLSVHVHFEDTNDKGNIVDKQWPVNLDDHITAEDTAKDVPVIFENGFVVKPGKYALRVEITDENNTARTGKYTEELEIPSFDQSSLNISDLAMATQVL